MITGKEAKTPIPLLFPAIVWILGIVLGFYLYSTLSTLPPNTIIIASATTFLLLLSLYVFIKRRSIRFGILLLTIFLLAFLRSFVFSSLPPNHINNLLDKKGNFTQKVTFTITEEPKFIDNEFGLSYLVRGEFSHIAGNPTVGRFQSYIPARFIDEEQAPLVFGKNYSMIAEVVKVPSDGLVKFPELRFNQHKYPQVRAYPKGLVKGEVSGTEKELSKYKHLLNNVRVGIVNRIDSRFTSEEGAFVKAVLLGIREDVGELRDLIDKGGMAHLLAISGLHLALIVFLLSLILKIFRIRRTPLWITLIIFLIFYGELCNWSPSISRAAVMLSLIMISLILQRKPCYNNTLIATVLIITAVNPAQIFSVGLQLSFLSVLILINIVPYFDKSLLKAFKKRFGLTELRGLHKLLYDGTMLLIVSTFMAVFLTPLTIIYFNRFSLNGIVGNLLSIPLMGILLPLSVLLIALPEVPALILPYHKTLSLAYSIFYKWVNFSAHLPFYYDFVKFGKLQLTLSYLLLISLCLFIRQRILLKELPSNESETLNGDDSLNLIKKAQRYRVATLIFTLLFLISLFPFSSDKLRITFYDVDHGDLFLIVTPQKEHILIDTGPTKSMKGHFKKSALPNFRERGIKKIDWLIITHPHKDHHGGFKSVSKNVKVNNLMVNDFFTKSDIWNEYKEVAIERGINTVVIQDTTSIQLKKLRLKIIHPDKHFSTENVNDNSIVAKLTYGSFSALFTGDIELDAENYLVRNYETYLDSRLLKVAHHGSITSTSIDFMERVNPDFAVISVESKGKRNLPHPIILKSLNYLNENLFLTSKDGTIDLITDGYDVIISTSGSKRRVNHPLIISSPASQ